jgi:hypothetical protein
MITEVSVINFDEIDFESVLDELKYEAQKNLGIQDFLLEEMEIENKIIRKFLNEKFEKYNLEFSKILRIRQYLVNLAYWKDDSCCFIGKKNNCKCSIKSL